MWALLGRGQQDGSFARRWGQRSFMSGSDQHLWGVPLHLQAQAFKQVASISVCLLPSLGVLVAV